MPFPFQPLIGSSFDALGGQALAWQGMNNQTDAANIARANAAQENQNRWLQTVAQMQAAAQQRDLETQQQAEAIARNQATIAQQQAEQRRQFNIGVGIDKQRLEAENLRTKEMGRVAEENAALQRHAAEQRIESAGQTLADRYLPAKNNSDAANAAFDKISDDFYAAQSDYQAEQLKQKPDPKKLKSLGDKVKLLQAQSRTAGIDKERAANALAAVHNQQGFMVDTENGYIKHLDTGKTWSFSGRPPSASATVTSTGPIQGPAWSGFRPPAPAPSPAPVPVAVPASAPAALTLAPVSSGVTLGPPYTPPPPVPAPAPVTATPQIGFTPRPSVLSYWGGRAAQELGREGGPFVDFAANVATAPAQWGYALAKAAGRDIRREATGIGEDVQEGYRRYAQPVIDWLNKAVRPPPPPGEVWMIDPDGNKVGSVPEGDVKKAEAKGYKKID